MKYYNLFKAVKEYELNEDFLTDEAVHDFLTDEKKEHKDFIKQLKSTDGYGLAYTTLNSDEEDEVADMQVSIHLDERAIAKFQLIVSVTDYRGEVMTEHRTLEFFGTESGILERVQDMDFQHWYSEAITLCESLNLELS